MPTLCEWQRGSLLTYILLGVKLLRVYSSSRLTLTDVSQNEQRTFLFVNMLVLTEIYGGRVV